MRQPLLFDFSRWALPVTAGLFWVEIG